MNDLVNPSPPEPHANSGYETTDVNPVAIGVFALGLVIMTATVLLLLGWVFWRMEGVAKRTDRPQSSASVDQTFTGPKLQDQPSAELAHFRSEENRRLTSYAWINREQGVVHIPVERAIKVLAVRGLPEPREPVKPTENQDIKP